MIPFTKMHALGNDFMIIDTLTYPMDPITLPIQALSDRHTGVGFDQLLILVPTKKADFLCRIFNADGSEAEQCGNGLRCIARYAYENKLTTSKTFTIATIAGVYPVIVHQLDYITVSLGLPVFSTLPEIELNDGYVIQDAHHVDVGNPHVILKVRDVTQVPVESTGSQLSTHSNFKTGVNVGFMEVVTPSHIRLRTYERGLGETHACGSNACAAAVTGIKLGWLEPEVHVEFRHGKLTIQWAGNHQPIQMTGPAHRVFDGRLLNC